MRLQQTIRRILKEETDLSLAFRRRINFDGVSDLMKSKSLKNLYRHSRDVVVEISANEVASNMLLTYREDYGKGFGDKYDEILKSLEEYLMEKYGKETNEYIDKVLPEGSFNNDGHKYIFRKHSEIGGAEGIDAWGQGFTQSFDNWGELITSLGWWFPINWWEVKTDLDKIDEGTKLILKPNDKHNTMGYYFSIIKKKDDSTRKIFKEGTDESKFFHRRINLDKVKKLIPLYAQEVYHETKSYQQYKFELTLRAVESVIYKEHGLGWEDLPSEEEIKFVTRVSDMFEDTIKNLYKLQSQKK